MYTLSTSCFAEFLAKSPPQPTLHTAGKFDRSPSEKRPTVLVVDDEPLIADTLVEILNDSGFDAIALYDGKTALEQIDELCPDAVVTDVIMPGINGVELAKAVRDKCTDTRIFLLSGQAASAELIHDARADGYSFELLAKPLHPAVLLKKLTV